MSLVHGDANIIRSIYLAYQYVATETCYYCYYRYRSHVSIEELAQQAHLELLYILTKRVCGTGKIGLAQIKPCGCCLGLRPYLISSVRQQLKIFIFENARIIKVNKVIYERAYIQQHGAPNPPKCISNIACNGEGEEFTLPDSVPVYMECPSQIAIFNETIRRLKLTGREAEVLRHRLMDKTGKWIAKHMNISAPTVSRIIYSIQRKYLDARI